jgi:hypothetical protein
MAKQQSALGVGITLNRTEKLREKLIAEITEYERQLVGLKLDGTHVNFSMIQTYKELIHSRQEMLNGLPRSF